MPLKTPIVCRAVHPMRQKDFRVGALRRRCDGLAVADSAAFVCRMPEEVVGVGLMEVQSEDKNIFLICELTRHIKLILYYENLHAELESVTKFCVIKKTLESRLTS